MTPSLCSWLFVRARAPPGAIAAGGAPATAPTGAAPAAQALPAAAPGFGSNRIVDALRCCCFRAAFFARFAA
eukprot:COSAG04_NODE_8580_length_955_cov_1.281542_1_plen_71_part_10